MDISTFMNNFKLKNQKTVKKWLQDGLIPGSYIDKQGNWIISELARPPYTKARAKTAGAIYLSIIEACNKRYGVCAKIYKISESEFSEYISLLKKENLISVKKDKGVEFYFATPRSEQYINDKKMLKKILENAIDKVIGATVTIAINSALNGVAG